MRINPRKYFASSTFHVVRGLAILPSTLHLVPATPPASPYYRPRLCPLHLMGSIIHSSQQRYDKLRLCFNRKPHTTEAESLGFQRLLLLLSLGSFISHTSRASEIHAGNHASAPTANTVMYLGVLSLSALCTTVK